MWLRAPVDRPHVSQCYTPEGYPSLAELCSESLLRGRTVSNRAVSRGEIIEIEVGIERMGAARCRRVHSWRVDSRRVDSWRVDSRRVHSRRVHSRRVDSRVARPVVVAATPERERERENRDPSVHGGLLPDRLTPSSEAEAERHEPPGDRPCCVAECSACSTDFTGRGGRPG